MQALSGISSMWALCGIIGLFNYIDNLPYYIRKQLHGLEKAHVFLMKIRIFVIMKRNK